MTSKVEAVYENGVFRPLHPIELPEHSHVFVNVGVGDSVELPHFPLEPDRWQAFRAALDAPAMDIPALRRLMHEQSVFDVRDS